MSTNTQELKQIQAYLQTQVKQTINQSELKSEQSQPSKKNYLPWILGGMGMFALMAGLNWYFMRQDNK